MTGKIPGDPTAARMSHLESASWRKFLLWGLRNIPPGIQRASMPLWSMFFYLQVPGIRRAIESNLSVLCDLSPPRRQLMAFRTFTNYCQCVAHAYSFHAGITETISHSVTGLEHLTGVLAGGNGAVLATGHLGNWHLGPYFLCQHGLPPVTVVMNQEPDRGTQRMEEEMRDRNMQVVYSNQSPLLNLALRAALRRGELVAFQMDRPASNRGLRVSCAGKEATFALGPALLARTCEVPVVPVFFPLVGAGVEVIVRPPRHSPRTADRQADLQGLTRSLAEDYGEMIRRYPDQWFNFYRFWNGGDPT